MNTSLLRLPLVVLGAALLAALLAALSGCGSSAPPRFYTLQPATSNAAAGTPATGASLAVTAVTIPGTLDRPQMVRFVNAERLDLFEEARWGEPLAHGIARTLAEDLSSRLSGAAVAAYPQDASARARYRISVDFSHLDVQNDGSVVLDAIWTMRDTYVAPVGAGGVPPAPVRTTERIKTAHVHLLAASAGTGAEASVATQSNALGQLADQLAAAFTEFASAS